MVASGVTLASSVVACDEVTPANTGASFAAVATTLVVASVIGEKRTIAIEYFCLTNVRNGAQCRQRLSCRSLVLEGKRRHDAVVKQLHPDRSFGELGAKQKPPIRDQDQTGKDGDRSAQHGEIDASQPRAQRMLRRDMSHWLTIWQFSEPPL